MHVCTPSPDLPPPPPPDERRFVLPPQRSKWPMALVLVAVLVSAVVGLWLLSARNDGESTSCPLSPSHEEDHHLLDVPVPRSATTFCSIDRV